MNNKEQRNLRKDWLFVMLAAMVGFFVNLAASSVYDLYISEFSWKIIGVLIISASLSFFAGSLFTYLFDNLDELRNQDNTFSDVLKSYLMNSIKVVSRKNGNSKESINVLDHVKTFHELMIVILRRRSLFRLYEKNLKGKAVEDDVNKNAFSSYYTMDYVRGQLIDLRKFFETDISSYKISDLVSYVRDKKLRKLHRELFKKWKKNFSSPVNQLIAHIDKNSKEIPREVKKKSMDEFIDETNIFLNEVIKGVRTKEILSLDDSFRDPNGEFLNAKQEEEFDRFREWFCSNRK